MNFIGHIHLARLHLARDHHDLDADKAGRGAQPGAARQPAEFLLGAALPDFAAMGKFRLTGRALDESIRAGVDLHHRTDDVFHSHLWFRTNSQQISDELERAGLPRGAAKACGHVGVELLLDGQLLEEHPGLRDATVATLSGVDEPGLGLTPLVDPDRRPDWTRHLESISTWNLPGDYRRPDAVAERLRRILARRPRLAFTAEHLELVSQTLGEHQATMEAGSADLIDDLDELLAA